MTFITSEAELQEKIKRAEADFALWNTYTFKEVYEHLYSTKNKKNTCMR